MTPPPRPPRRHANPERDRQDTSRKVAKKVLAAEIPLPPPARLQPDGASRPVFLRQGRSGAATPSPPSGSLTPPIDDALPAPMLASTMGASVVVALHMRHRSPAMTHFRDAMRPVWRGYVRRPPVSPSRKRPSDFFAAFRGARHGVCFSRSAATQRANTTSLSSEMCMIADLAS